MSFDDILLNMIIVSIPEEIVMTLIALVIMQRYDYMDKYDLKDKFKRIFFIVALPYAIISTLILYGFGLNIYLRTIINLMAFTILMIILLKGEKIFKIFASTFLSLTIIYISETFTLLVFIYIFNLEFSLMNTSPWTNFLITMPFRILQISILYMIYVKKNSIAKIKVLEIWDNNRIFRRFVMVYVGFNILASIYLYNKFAVERCLENIPSEIQLVIVIIVSILYTVELIIPWVMMYVIYPSEKLRNRLN